MMCRRQFAAFVGGELQSLNITVTTQTYLPGPQADIEVFRRRCSGLAVDTRCSSSKSHSGNYRRCSMEIVKTQA
eukprot:3933095-Rhodomonas_salina.1